MDKEYDENIFWHICYFLDRSSVLQFSLVTPWVRNIGKCESFAIVRLLIV
jgi:hypothetical protein